MSPVLIEFCSMAPLVGRTRERAHLAALITGGARAVSIVGPAGVGKTRLAVAALDDLASSGTATVAVALATVRDARVMADAILAAVLGPIPSAPTPADALWQRFTGAPVAVLLDNLEQVAGADAVVGELLAGYPSVVVVATSLVPLRVPGESVVALRPLGLPRDDAAPGEPQQPALTLFLERAAVADLDFAVDDLDTRQACARICRLLGGLPLALELAAARVGTIPAPLMADQLERTGGLALLRRGSANGRRDSLAEALRWTVDLLPRPAVELLAALSVFEGPASLAAVAAVAPPGHDPVDLVAELLDLHLVQPDADRSGQPRFRLLPPVRAFADGLFAGRQQRTDALRAHDDHMRARATGGTPLAPEEVADTVAALDRLRLAGQADVALELALAVADQPGGPGSSAALRARMEDLLEEDITERVLEARALVWTLARPTARGAGEPGSPGMDWASWTQARVERSLRVARASGDPGTLLDALELTVRTVSITMNRELGLAGIQEGLALAERTGDPGRLARFRMWAGMVASAFGRPGEATALLVSARELGAAAPDQLATDYADMFLIELAQDGAAVPDLALPDLETLLQAAWRRHDHFAASLLLSLVLRRALAADDIAGAAQAAGEMVSIGGLRLTVDPVAAVIPVCWALQVLVAAGDLRAAAVAQGHLAQYGSLLAKGMGRSQHAGYLAAVAVMESALPAATRQNAAGEGAALGTHEVLMRTQRALRALSPAAGSRGASGPAAGPVHEPLTPREDEVLQLLGGGASNPEIAARLGISSKTVMHHTVAIYRKLGVRGRAEAAAWAVRAGRSTTAARQGGR